MNCTEFQDNLVAYLEGLLEEKDRLEYEAHLNRCTSCRTDCEGAARLRKQLAARGNRTADVSAVEPVMLRILQREAKSERTNIMSFLHTKWGIGLSAAAGIVLVVLSAFLLISGGQATAAEILERGAKAISGLANVHMRCRLRTLPDDNFGLIGPGYEFVDVEIWKEFGESPKWRIDKPGRLAIMDGRSTMMIMKPFDRGVKIDHPTRYAFDTKWLLEVADTSQILTNELQAIRADRSILQLNEEADADGKTKAVVSIENITDLPEGDYLKNVFFNTSDTRRVYVFDTETDRLEAVKIYLLQPSGQDLIFETVQIDYDQPMDQSVFHPTLPDTVTWIPDELPDAMDNAFYASLTPEQAAETLFRAIGNRDWDEAQKFFRAPIDERFKQSLGGLAILDIGESFQSAAYPGVFVPYEISLPSGETRKHNLALKKDKRTSRWIFDGGI
jgi:hypothetical protein